MIWTYMGPDQADLPPLRNVEWNLVPQEQVHISFASRSELAAGRRRRDRLRSCPLLHGRLDAQGTTSAWIQKRDLRPL